jgi:hypothetical protein
MAIRPALD